MRSCFFILVVFECRYLICSHSLRGTRISKPLVGILLSIITGVRKSSWGTNRVGKWHFKFIVTHPHYIVPCLLVSWDTWGTTSRLFLWLNLCFILERTVLHPVSLGRWSQSGQLTWVPGWHGRGQAGGGWDELGPNFPQGWGARHLAPSSPPAPCQLLGLQGFTGCTKK